MPLQVRMANAIKIDDQGWASATIEDITYLSAEENEYGPQYRFDFFADGTKRTINLKIWSGTSISAQKYENGPNEDYSKLTRICLQLGLFTESQLKKFHEQGQEPDCDLEDLIGKKVRFKLLKKVKTGKLSQIDINTLKLVKESAQSSSKNQKSN